MFWYFAKSIQLAWFGCMYPYAMKNIWVLVSFKMLSLNVCFLRFPWEAELFGRLRCDSCWFRRI